MYTQFHCKNTHLTTAATAAAAAKRFRILGLVENQLQAIVVWLDSLSILVSFAIGRKHFLNKLLRNHKKQNTHKHKSCALKIAMATQSVLFVLLVF